MHFPALSRLWQPRGLLAVFGGVCWALAFPNFNFSGLAWIAPALLLLATFNASGWRRFRLGYLAGLTHHLVALHWLLYNPFPAGAAAGWIALSAYLALFPAAWVCLAWQLLPPPPLPARGSSTPCPRSGPGSSTPTPAAPPPTRPGLDRILELPWVARTLWCVAGAAAWAAVEMLQARLFTGFPWNLLGVTQYRALPLIQSASVTGVYGISFFVVWGSLALLTAGFKLAGRIRQPALSDFPHPSAPFRDPNPPAPTHRFLSFRWALFTDLALPMVTLLGLMLSGTVRLVVPIPTGPKLKLALIQPSIPQRIIFDPTESTNRFEAIMQLTRLALAAHPDLLVWPEASLPDLDETHFRTLTDLVATNHVWMVFGADDAESRLDPDGTTRYDAYNSAFLLNPSGRIVASYRKQQLVIFGEYIPLVDWLPFTRHLTPIQASYRRGRGPVPFQLRQPNAKTSVLICFEDVFPHLARGYVESDTDFLLNLTNNGWFGESAAQWQHAANAVFRAVENGLPLVRCANNGLTCWVDALGRIRELGPTDRASIYGPGFRIVQIPTLRPNYPSPPTFYRLHGDVFGWACVGLTLVTLAQRLLPIVFPPRSTRVPV